MTKAESTLSQFGALALTDPTLHMRLGEIGDAAQFAAAASASAVAHGLPLAPHDLLYPSNGDAVGVSRLIEPTVQGSRWPPPQWLPIQVAAGDEELVVDWTYFGTRRLTESFFEGSVRRALRLPFSRLSGYRMSLRDFIDHAEDTQSLAPSGFIFHMSRCGSTLTAQMLAALPRTVVVSEAAPIDAVVQLGHGHPDDVDARHARLLAAMVAAYGRHRSGDERNFVVKLDSWHTLALPLFARAFPSTPWVFLYRDPVEVLVSQMRQPGSQMVPEFMPPNRYGIEVFDGVPDADYYACVLERICRAVVENAGNGRALLIDYRELPEAVFTKIMPHFGITGSESECEAMRFAASRDAKAPGAAFLDDRESKQREASDNLRALTERHIGGVYRELEALRAGRSG